MRSRPIAVINQESAQALWTKTRINLAQEFVIGGHISSHLGIDSLVVGFYKDKDLHYAARVRAGFVPATRRQVFDAIKHLQSARRPFVNLHEKKPGRWGEGFTSEKMKKAVWIKPEAVALIEFLEWSGRRSSPACQVNQLG